MKENKYFIIIFIFSLILLLIGYNNFNRSNSLINSSNVDPNDYSIIRIETIGNYKASIDVRLKRELYKSEIEQLAYTLKKNLSKKYERIFICYYMPGMKVGKGAWATSHFEPDLNIFMTSNFYDDTKKNNFENTFKVKDVLKNFKKKYPTSHIIGKWYENNNFIIIFFRQKHKNYLIEINTKSNIMDKPFELLKKKKMKNEIYIIKELLYPKNMGDIKLINDYNDFYKIEQNGDLTLYDNIGIIERYKKIK